MAASGRPLPPGLRIAAFIAAASLVIWGSLYTRAYSTMRAEVDALREMNRRLWTEVHLLQTELDMLDSDLRREGFEWTRAPDPTHDKGD